MKLFIYRSGKSLVKQVSDNRNPNLDYLTDAEVREYLKEMEALSWEEKRAQGFVSCAIRSASGEVLALNKYDITDREKALIEKQKAVY